MPTLESRLDESPLEALRALADEYRSSCLWFLRANYYPSTAGEWLRLLDRIERQGDREAFRKAATARQWLSRTSSAESVVS